MQVSAGLRNFREIYLKGYRFAPGIGAMKGNPGYKNWGERVTACANRADLAPFRRVFSELVEGKLLDLDPLWRFSMEEGLSIAFEDYLNASALAEAEAKTNPACGYVLALVALAGWSFHLNEELFAQDDGRPHRGWVSIPYAFIYASLKLGDLDSTKDLAEMSYGAINAAKQLPFTGELQTALHRYRELRIKIYQRLDSAVTNLADELYQSMFTTPDHFRCEVNALLWTLGYIPESQTMRTAGVTPTRSFLKKVVWASMDRIPYDPLVQYIWLEMKDRPPFRLRDHRPLFDKINLRWGQYTADELAPIPPSQIYAKTLIAWLKGELTPDQVGQYLQVADQAKEYEQIRHTRDKADWTVYLRIRSLAYLLARQFDYFAGEVTPEQERDIWLSLWSQVVRMRGQYHLNPMRPDLGGTLNHPLFQLPEGDPSAPGAGEDSIRLLEQYRAAAIAYSLSVTPPLVTGEAAGGLAEFLEREQELLEWLRGAYFLIQYETLPDHFRLFAADVGEFWGSDPNQFLNRETGLKEYQTIQAKLKDLYTEMKAAAPQYSAQRTQSYADVDQIVEALRSHTVSAKMTL